MQSLMDRARRRADMVNSNFVSDAELIDWINEGWTELYDKLVSAYGEDYFFESTTGSTVASQPNYDLPSNFYKDLGIGLERNAGSGKYHPVRKFMERDANRLIGSGGALSELKYRIRENELIFAPAPASVASYQIRYIPSAAVLNNFTFASDDVSVAANTITEALHGLVDKSMCLFSSTGTLATGLTLGQLYYVVYVDLNTFSLSLTKGGSAVDITGTGSGNSTFLSVIDGINGWERYIVDHAAIQMKDKEESDTRVLYGKQKKMAENLTAMAAKRDLANPERVTDVERWNCEDDPHDHYYDH